MHGSDMISAMSAFTPQPLDQLQIDPLELLRRWPTDRPVALLRSATESAPSSWSRWSVLAAPAGHLRIGDHITWSGEGDPPCQMPSDGTPPMAALDQILRTTPDGTTPTEHPDVPLSNGGWLAVCSYALGQAIEPTVIGSEPHTIDGRWPLIDLLWCPEALVHDATKNAWWSIGGCQLPALREPAGEPDGLPVPESTPGRDQYIDRVQQVIEYIHAGDVFQVNLARQLHTTASLAPRGLAAAALRTANPRYGFYAELPGDDGDRAVLSLSPELFLQVDGSTRRVVTRPIKGTRPGTSTPEELAESAKDAAELHMIVDLMRNDLGRVCEPGSVRVVEGRTIESHPTVHHGVGEIHGTLHDDVGLAGLLEATFPPGSITGAPKIRAMQIIHELEPFERGPYCGAMGWMTRHDACLSVGIRTLALHGTFEHGFARFEGDIHYGTGGGIVSDSSPHDEFRETEDKAAVFERLVGAPATCG